MNKTIVLTACVACCLVEEHDPIEVSDHPHRMSANKQRDWMDYAGLASQLYQNAQVNDVRDKMAAMGQIALIKEAREQQELSEKQRLDHARDFLFTCTNVMAKVKMLSETNLRGSVLVALNMQRKMPETGLKTSLFPDFADKQRLTDLQQELADFLETNRPRLSETDRGLVAECERYQEEENELEQALRLTQEFEEHEARKSRLEEIKEVQLPNAGHLVILAGFGIGLVLAALGFASGDRSGEVAGMVIGGGAAVISLIVGLAIQNSNATLENQKLFAEKQQLEAHLNQVGPLFRERGSPGKVFPVIAGIGANPSSQELSAELERRRKFVEEAGNGTGA